MTTVMILGGYGGFGARLARRLADDGWQVLVAGRTIDAARRLAAQLPGARPVLADRNGDLAPILEMHRPLLLVDAAGPFQQSDYRVAETCIAHGVHYIDLADARDFVCGIGELDERARAAGVVVIAGASSVPALSGAVVRELTRGMETVRSIAMSISASNRATAGASVAAAILSYAGKPVRLWKGRRWQDRTGWQGLRRETYALGSGHSLNRWVALADVPDHEILPAAVPGHPSTVFRAGPESALQIFALWCLSWPVRWGWLTSLTGLAPWLRPLQRFTAGGDSGRSAMAVEVKGACGGRPTIRRWTLIAEHGCGPEIPTLAAHLLARDVRESVIEAGARHAGGLLRLASFEALFAPLSIADDITTASYRPLYGRVMGERFDRLPEPVRAMHDVIGDGGAEGIATVTRGSTTIARFVASVMGFPREGTHRVHVSFEEKDGVERWTRTFSDRGFSSELSQRGDRLVERFGPLRFTFDLPSERDGLRMVMVKWSACGIPMPLSLGPRSLAREHADNDDFLFDVPIALPLIGLVVHYKGRLRRS